MRALQVLHGFPPHERGGTELYAESLAFALRDLGDEVFALARSAIPGRPEYSLTREDRDGLTIARLQHTFRDSRGFAGSYRNATVGVVAEALLDEVRPDVVHVHHLTGLSVDLLEACARRGLPTVVTLHDFWLICHRGQLLDRDLRLCAGPLPDGCARCLGVEAGGAAPHGSARLLRALTAKLPRVGGALRRGARAVSSGAASDRRVRAASAAATLERARFVQRQLSFADLLLAPSRAIRERFLAFGVPAERLQLHELGIPLDPFRDSRRERRERVRGEALRLGFLGSLMVSKGAHLLLGAFARLQPGEAVLHVFGDVVPYHGDDSYRAQVARLLKQPGVVHHGALPHERVAAALAELDAAVVPSIWEETSLVIREAFAAGVPVVAARVGGMAEAVVDGTSGLLFTTGDAVDLERCLRRLLDEPMLLARLRAGIPPVRDIRDDAAATRELYARVADQRRSQSAAGSVAAKGRQSAAARPRLAAVVLHHRTPEDTLLAARSLQASRRRVDDLLIVDNGSADGSAALLREQLAGATVLETGANLGFSAGCNVGIRAALDRGADLVLLLNSDALLPPDALDTLVDALADPDVGIAGPLLLSRADPDRIASAGITYSPRSGRMGHLLAGVLADAAPRDTRRVDGVAGCALLVRRDVLERVGLLAEEFFFSFEDLDLCLRARAAGFATVRVGAARGYHEGGRTIGARAPVRLYYGSRNHLLLASRANGGGSAVRALARGGAVVGLNLAHALLTAGVPRVAGVRAVLRGVRDHRRGRYGAAP